MSIKDTFSSPFVYVKGKLDDSRIQKALTLGIATTALIVMSAIAHSNFQNEKEVLQNNLAFVDKNKALNDCKPLSIADIRSQFSPQSEEITKQFGGKDMVIVLPSDPKSDFFLVNYPNKFDTQFNDPGHGDGGTFTKAFKYKNNPVGRLLYEYTKEEWNLLVDRSNMFSNGTTANVNRSGLDDGQTVAFLRPESPSNFTENRRRVVPYVTTLEELNQWGFFHEVTHARDTGVHTRNYLDTREKYGIDIDEEAGQLIAESIADVGAALVALRVTENFDTYNYLTRPMRFLMPTDEIHSTQHLADAVLRGVSLEDVKGKSDIELMAMAEHLVDQHVVQEVKKYQSSNHGLYPETLSEHFRNMRGGVVDLRADMMRESALAIEASMQNLSYQGKVSEYLPELNASIQKHIRRFHDTAMLGAYEKSVGGNASSKGEVFSPEIFGKEMSYTVDWSSHLRKDQNSSKIHDYYMKVTSNRLGFDQENIIVNRLALEKRERALVKEGPKQTQRANSLEMR